MAGSTKKSTSKALGKRESKQDLAHSFNAFRRLFSYAQPYYCLIIFGNISLIATAVLNILIPKGIGDVIDILSHSGGLEALKKSMFYLTIILLSSVVFDTLKEFCFDLLSVKVIQRMRGGLFKSLLEKDIEFYDMRKTGDLISRLTAEIERVQNSSTGDLSNLIRRILEMAGSIIFLFTISPTLTIASFFFIPIKIIMLTFKGKKLKRKSKQINDAIAEANCAANEAFQNIRVIKSFSTEQKEFTNYKNKLHHTYNLEFNTILNTGFESFIRNILAYGGLLGMIWLGGSMVIEGKVTTGDLTSFIFCVKNLSTAFNSIDKVIKRFAISLASCENIFEILDYVPKINDNAVSGVKTSDFQGNIDLENLTFAYPTKKDVNVLENINLEIKNGETVAIVGASGGGKSTFINLLERFYDVDHGQVLIDGINIKEYNLNWLHQQIGYVPQESYLFSGTILDNVTYGVSSYDEKTVENALKLANADFVLNKKLFPLGLQTSIGEKGSKLSGGQKQRIAIARAIIKNPRILIFDEATSALDAESEYQVQKAIESLMKQGNRTVIIIAHRLSTIMSCKTIAVFQEGKIAEKGDHNQLLSQNGLYKNLVERQLGQFRN